MTAMSIERSMLYFRNQVPIVMIKLGCIMDGLISSSISTAWRPHHETPRKFNLFSSPLLHSVQSFVRRKISTIYFLKLEA